MKNLEEALKAARAALTECENEIAESFRVDALGPSGALLVRKAELVGGISALESVEGLEADEIKALLETEEAYFLDVQGRPEVWHRALNLDWVEARKSVELLRRIVAGL